MILLRPTGGSPGREQLTSLISECDEALGERLKPLATQVSCDRAGTIDMLAADASNRLVIVDVDPEAGDGLLLRGILHYAWLIRNTAALRWSIGADAVDFSVPPRVFLVARRFPPLFADSVRHVSGPEVRCVRYHALDLALGTGVFFEPLDDDYVFRGSSAPSVVFT